MKLFKYNDTPIRTIEEGGGVWFVASDVARVLGPESASRIARMADEEDKGFHKVETLGGVQRLATLNESGLYTALIRSSSPNAKPSRKWVTSEVLPVICRHGSCGVWLSVAWEDEDVRGRSAAFAERSGEGKRRVSVGCRACAGRDGAGSSVAGGCCAGRIGCGDSSSADSRGGWGASQCLVQACGAKSSIVVTPRGCGRGEGAVTSSLPPYGVAAGSNKNTTHAKVLDDSRMDGVKRSKRSFPMLSVFTRLRLSILGSGVAA